MKNLAAILVTILIMILPGVIDILVDATPTWMINIIATIMALAIPVGLAALFKTIAQEWDRG